MSDYLDKLSYYIKIATDVLIVRNPVGTGMGFFFGIIIDGLVAAISPLVNILNAMRQAGLNVVHFIALGVVGFNAKTWLKRDEVDPRISEAIEFVEAQVKAGRISKIQAKIHYNDIIAKVVDNVRLDADVSDRIKKIAE